jgi:hypothetical protein
MGREFVIVERFESQLEITIEKLQRQIAKNSLNLELNGAGYIST